MPPHPCEHARVHFFYRVLDCLQAPDWWVDEVDLPFPHRRAPSVTPAVGELHREPDLRVEVEQLRADDQHARDVLPVAPVVHWEWQLTQRAQDLAAHVAAHQAPLMVTAT